MLVKGGIVMIPLMLTSVIALAVVIERGLFLRRSRILNPDLIQLILHIKNPGELKDALDTLKHQDGSFINIVRVALEHQHEPASDIRESIVDQDSVFRVRFVRCSGRLWISSSR